jgi:hypothetical protein
VRLARHKPGRHHHRALFDAALKKEPLFQEYQETQTDSAVIAQFRKARHIAGFIVEPGTRHTVFAGVWNVLGERAVSVRGQPIKPGHAVFETMLREDFDHYRGRLLIDWGLLGGERAWVQRADKQNKHIAEIRRRIEEPSFPGFIELQLSLAKVETIPFAWAQVLRNARGIYLLVHRESGQQYVGSAYGDEGFLGRWKSYADGHGGNVALKELGAKAEAFDVSVLEVVGSGASNEQIFDRESLWKAKLGTRVKGLNRN